MLRFILAFNKHILSTIIHFFVFQMLCVWVDPIYQSGQQKARVSTYRTYYIRIVTSRDMMLHLAISFKTF